MFLIRHCNRGFYGGLPRIRGGVSFTPNAISGFSSSSPHTRGCFFYEHESGGNATVFPAYAGVFLTLDMDSYAEFGLPRIRGGVSRRDCTNNNSGRSSPHTRGCFRCYFQKMKKPIERSTGYFCSSRRGNTLSTAFLFAPKIQQIKPNCCGSEGCDSADIIWRRYLHDIS